VSIIVNALRASPHFPTKGAVRSIKVLIAEARKILSKLDDAFEGMIDDNDFIDGWFDIRKIKGRRKAKPKNDDNNNAPEA
jgi:hypothetical protein